ncbi:MAG TPA: TIGR03435 family protein [Bryobacteraceae bacterium]|nr:TIGR03435 family protein [Bryobacteraceae bacterium]
MPSLATRAVLLSFTLVCVLAQPKKGFEVATIKPNAEKDNRFMMPGGPQGGTYKATGVTLKMLIMYAYGVRAAFQVAGGPSWIGTERWDIQAKVAGETPVTRDQFLQMLRDLLEDRFQLKARRESKEMPVYELVVAKNGPKLTPHTGGAPKPEDRIRIRYGSLQFRQGTPAGLAFQLSVQLGRTVIDKTGLTGEYDFNLEWAPEPGQGGLEGIGLPPDPNLPLAPADPNRASIFIAIQEQLGLHLESQKGPVEMVVIDSVEKPSAN